MREVIVWCGMALALLGHALLMTGIVNRMHGLRGPRVVIKSITALCVLGLVAIPALAILQMRAASPVVGDVYRHGGWLGGYTWACTAVGALGLVAKPWWERRRHDRRVLVDWTVEPRDVAKALGGSPLAGPIARALGWIPGNEASALSVDRKQLVLPRLPAELDGLTIAHLSDFHMTGRLSLAYYEYVARTVNDLRPDVIAVTGDIIESEACWPWLGKSLGRLCAPLGVYFVLGNHDEFIDQDRTRALLVDEGLTCLSGRWRRAQWNGVTVTLGGNELPWMPAASLEQLPTRRTGEDEFRLALCHSPDQIAWCQSADIDLALAGHTHGGQVRLPWLGPVLSPSLYGSRYACGVFRRGTAVMHVTRGIGGETLWRWRCAPEIALLRLVADKPS
jgi:uncharacterized protein